MQHRNSLGGELRELLLPQVMCGLLALFGHAHVARAPQLLPLGARITLGCGFRLVLLLAAS